MRNIWLIAKREYRQRVRARSFKVVTAIGFLLILAAAFAPAVLDRVQSFSGGSTVAVVDPNEEVSPALRAALPEELPNGEPQTEVVAVESREAAERGVEGGEYDGFLVSEGSGADASFTYSGPQPDAEAARIEEALGALAAEERLREAGLGEEEIAGAFAPADLDVVATGDAVSGEEYASAFGVVYAFGFVLYMTLIMYGNMVAMGVIGEKSTRITEIMTASVKPTEQMSGKLLGVGMLSLTQFGAWAVAGLITLVVDNVRGGEGLDLVTIPPGTLALFVVFFVFGFLLYASLFAGLGSLLSRVEDAGPLMAPFSMLLIGGFLLTLYSMTDPDGPVSTVGSFIPFFTPMVMFARIELGDPALWEVALGVGILLGTTVLAIWAAAKLYKAGVLMYGKGPSFAGAMRMIGREPESRK
jgi:ABC-2 type transport system permease protein